MRLLTVAIANVNTTVGAQRSNVDRAITLAGRAAAEGADLVAFPAQLVSGYPHEDLVQWRRFVESPLEELTRFARETAPLGIVSVVGCTVALGARVYNCAALVSGGKIHGFVPKEKLPGYNVFYETRTLSSGTAGLRGEIDGVPFGDLVFDLDFGTVAIEVCEDVWSPDGPMRRRCYAGAELVVNLSASPFRLGLVSTRRELLATRANDNQCTLVYTNLVGANDGLVFDGGGFVVQNGRVLLEGPRFREGVATASVDLDRTTRLRTENTTWRLDQEGCARAAAAVHRVDVPGTGMPIGRPFPAPANASFFIPATPRDWRSPREEFCEDLLDALALGVGDYFEKNGVFKTIGVALSGGRDSLLCLWIARRWIDQKYADLDIDGRRAKAREILRAFFMPSRYSSAETTAAAEKTARELDAPLCTVSIDDSFERELGFIKNMLQPGEELGKMAHQNLGEQRRRSVLADEQHEREGRRLLDHRRRRRGGARGDRQRAQDGGELPPRLSVRTYGVRVDPPHPGEAGLRGAGRGDGGRARSHALPGARRLLLPLRRGEDVHLRGEGGAGLDVPAARQAAARRLGGALRPAVHHVDLQVGPGAAQPPRR